MGFLKVDNVKISGIVSAVPEKVVKNKDLDLFANQQEAEKFISITGIEEKRHAKIDECTSDLSTLHWILSFYVFSHTLPFR